MSDKNSFYRGITTGEECTRGGWTLERVEKTGLNLDLSSGDGDSYSKCRVTGLITPTEQRQRGYVEGVQEK